VQPPTSPPVMSALRYYERRGQPKRSRRPSDASGLVRQSVAPTVSASRPAAISRDLFPSYRRVALASVASALFATLPLHAHPEDVPINLTLTLNATALVLIGLAFAVGCVLGVIAGSTLYRQLLRDADHTATSYRARALAHIFAASGGLHATVEDLVRTASKRITKLQQTLTRIRMKEDPHVG
jgi:hypothetical protein